MDHVDESLAHGRRAVAEVRREIWPEYGGEWPDEATPDEMNRYIEALEHAVAGRAAAISLIGGALL